MLQTLDQLPESMRKEHKRKYRILASTTAETVKEKEKEEAAALKEYMAAHEDEEVSLHCFLAHPRNSISLSKSSCMHAHTDVHEIYI